QRERSDAAGLRPRARRRDRSAGSGSRQQHVAGDELHARSRRPPLINDENWGHIRGPSVYHLARRFHHGQRKQLPPQRDEEAEEGKDQVTGPCSVSKPSVFSSGPGSPPTESHSKASPKIRRSCASCTAGCRIRRRRSTSSSPARRASSRSTTSAWAR